MYSEASIFATNSIKLLQTNGRKVTPIKNVAGRMSASEPPAVRARHIHLALTVEELALEEIFYIFDYGNAM